MSLLILLRTAGVQQYTLTAEAGSFAYTGTAATLLVGRKLGATTAAFPWTGTDATLTYTPGGGSFTLTAESGSIAFGGTAATLLVGRRITAETAAFAFGGTAAGLRADRRIAANTTAFAYAGSAATLLVARRVSANSGTYTYTGTAASLRATRVIAASAGTYAWGGTAASLAHGYPLIASGASFAFTGSAASFVVTDAIAEIRRYRVEFASRTGNMRGSSRLCTLASQPVRTRKCTIPVARQSIILAQSRTERVSSSDMVGGVEVNMFTMPSKRSNEKLDYVVDWAAVFEAGETISTSVWTVPAGITQDTPAPSNTTTTAKIWLSGGTAGRSYAIINTVTTDGGSASRTFSRTISILVDDTE